jgi:Short repeat of unknown function (DUF308)
VAQSGAWCYRTDDWFADLHVTPRVSIDTGAFHGVYLFVGGLMSPLWGLSTHRAKGLWLAAGLIGTIGGVGILLCSFYGSYLPPELPITLFGIVALATGLVHTFGGFRIETLSQVHSWGSVLLGLMEVALGVLLLTVGSLAPFTKFIAASWAFVGGILLILQSFQIRRARMENIEPTLPTVQ